MATEPLNERDLADQLSEAKTDYQANWKRVDRELYELCCRRRPRHDDFDDVYPRGRHRRAGRPPQVAALPRCARIGR